MTELKEQAPHLAEKIKEAFDIALKSIAPHVIKSMEHGNVIAIHGTFVRLQDEETDEILYVQIRTAFAMMPAGLIATILSATFYESLEQYEAERQRLQKESENKFGTSDAAINFDSDGRPLN